MSVIDKINKFIGSDWSLDDINITYEMVSVKLSFNPENYHNLDGSVNENHSEIYAGINCINYIGFSFIGHWDENIIEAIKIETRGDLIVNSLKKIERLYGTSPLPGGGDGTKNKNTQWYQLNIRLIDGNIIKVACEKFEFFEMTKGDVPML